MFDAIDFDLLMIRKCNFMKKLVSLFALMLLPVFAFCAKYTEGQPYTKVSGEITH